MTLVVDASVAVKWFLPELHGAAALRLLQDGHRLLAPDLLFPEVGNVLWKRVRRREATAKEAGVALETLTSLPLEVYPSRPLLPVAFDIACAAGRTVYDSVYLAVAILRECAMVTADRKLYQALGQGRFSPHLLWIGDVPHE